jgi:nucleoside-specific outer membrane channel protein Tsx
MKVEMNAPTQAEFDDCYDFLNWLKANTEEMDSFSWNSEKFHEEIESRFSGVDHSFRRIMLACFSMLE